MLQEHIFILHLPLPLRRASPIQLSNNYLIRLVFLPISPGDYYNQFLTRGEISNASAWHRQRRKNICTRLKKQFWLPVRKCRMHCSVISLPQKNNCCGSNRSLILKNLLITPSNCSNILQQQITRTCSPPNKIYCRRN